MYIHIYVNMREFLLVQQLAIAAKSFEFSFAFASHLNPYGKQKKRKNIECF